ncbi:MAG: ParB/RepB/Spo0J family partition protein [Elusimicrobia bacterium]|nr:ParB/RepB/Spo0J family partition protein [Elusimicrobiota bacterium]
MRTALGRGIDSLITKVENNDISGDIVQRVPVDKIRPNRFQPRRNFDDGALAGLADSIKERGLLQPITVWKDSGDDHYELIAGERRWRAACLAGLPEIDAIVRKDLDDESKLGLSLIENIQREGLNAMDTALAYRQLMNQFGASQTEIAKKVGKSKTTVSNTLRLLELEETILNGLQSELIDEGHARALLSIPDKTRRREAYEKIISDKLSVRDVEAYAQGFHARRPRSVSKASARAHKSPEIAELESSLENILGTKVEIHPGAGPENGKIVIHYYSLDDFDRVTQILKK